MSKLIESHPDYSVTLCGKVLRHFKNGSIKLKKDSRHRDGYRVLDLYRNGKRSQKKVHQLVALAYVPGRTEERNTVNHKNKIKDCNAWYNLEWATNLEQQRHRIEWARKKEQAEEDARYLEYLESKREFEEAEFQAPPDDDLPW